MAPVYTPPPRSISDTAFGSVLIWSRWRRLETTALTFIDLFYRQYDKIHQKREEIVKMIEESNRETNKFREKMQKLREKCNQQTQRAQVHFLLSHS